MIQVDTASLTRLTVELKNIHKAALPNAVRFTLNDLAFDVKKNSLSTALHETMTIRNEPFFKRYSGVEKAIGYDINKMASTAGMIPSGDATKTVERLKEQDEGGTLRHDAIALDKARTGGSAKGKIKKGAYRQKMHFWGEKIQFGDKKGLIRAVTKSGITSGGSGKGNVVIYGKYVYEIIGFKRFSHEKIKLHLKQLYEYIPNRTVNLRPRKFTEKAGNITGKKAEEIFRINAERQLKKWTK